MNTFIIATAIVVIGFMFGRAMMHTADFFLQAIKNNQRDRDHDD
jgi:hypothetical protein|tara:strand:- start:747 stop:878 length:132 start_codon:yes stop_codon:yes gene_type:complete